MPPRSASAAAPRLTQASLSRRHILWSVDQSLRRLGTDWIDVYIAHKADPYTPLEETLQAFDDLVRTGKVRYLGFSNWSAWKPRRRWSCRRRTAGRTHGQMNYSLLGRDVERDVIPMMRRYGLGLTVWSPLASGFLSGKYSRASLSDPDNRYSGFDLLPFDKERGFALVRADPADRQALRRLGRASRARLAAVEGGGDQHPSGRHQAAQLEDNLAAMQMKVPTEDLAALDEATTLPNVYPNWFIEQLVDGELQKALG